MSQPDPKLILPVLKARVDIPTLMERCFGETEMRGSMMFCPFHQHHRRSPSFHVLDDGARFRCYACPDGAHGDVIEFWQIAFRRKTGRRLSFAGAVISLARLCGVEGAGEGTPQSTLLLLAYALRSSPKKKQDEVRLRLIADSDRRLNDLLLAVRHSGTSGACGIADWLWEQLDTITMSDVPYSTIVAGYVEVERLARYFLNIAESVAEFSLDLTPDTG